MEFATARDSGDGELGRDTVRIFCIMQAVPTRVQAELVSGDACDEELSFSFVNVSVNGRRSQVRVATVKPQPERSRKPEPCSSVSPPCHAAVSSHEAYTAARSRDERDGTHVRTTPSSAEVLAQRPTMDSLPPDVPIPGWQPALEWAPYSDAELSIAAYIHKFLGARAFEGVPYDLLLAYIRGHAYREDSRAVSYVYLERTLKWRRADDVDSILAAEGVSGYERFTRARAEFDGMMPSGIIGKDGDGHLVILDRPFAAPCKQLMGVVSDDEFVQHMVARREVCRAAIAAHAAKIGRRVYKVVAVIDVGGLGLAHISDAKFHHRMKRFFEHFTWHYPETQTCMVIVNAPRLFQAMWAVAKRFLHPMISARITVVGSSYLSALGDLGIVLDDGVLDGKKLKAPRPWIEKLARLKEEWPAELLSRGYIPPEDLQALRERCDCK